ncbi:MAG: pentapeptide repeat-containing protein [Candidatus Competibacteraceae bacterium]|nr:pentapeptide repeat-containing protein [Candidatus Competibacteraceae bacterium]
MAYHELDDEVKGQLQDIQSFNLSIADSGWHIRERLLDSLDLSNIVLHQSSLIDCDFTHVKLKQSIVSATRFESISFTDVDWSYSQFNEIEFINCNFTFCTQTGTKFFNCRFLNCQYKDMKSTSTNFENCEFEKFNSQNTTFKDCIFIQSQFLASQCHNTSFYGATIDRLTFNRCESNKLIFSNLKGQQLKFEEGHCSDSGFSRSELIGLGFFNCRIQGVTLNGFTITYLRLQECPEISNFHLMKSECTRPLIKNCGIVSEFSFYQSKVNDLNFIDSTLAYFELAESVLRGNSSISDCKCHGASFTDSEIDGLAIIHCQFTDYLVLNRSHFNDLQLRQVTYASNLEVDAEEVVYENSSRFGRD